MGTGSSVPDVFKDLEESANKEEGLGTRRESAPADLRSSESNSNSSGFSENLSKGGGGGGGGGAGGGGSKFLGKILRLLSSADVGKLVSAASLEQLDELNRVLCRPAVTELERKLAKASREAQPTIKLLLAASSSSNINSTANQSKLYGEENNDGGLYDGGVISELFGPEGHRAVVHRAVQWAVSAASFAPASPPEGTGRSVVESLHRLLCCAGFIHGLAIDQGAPSNNGKRANSARDLHGEEVVVHGRDGGAGSGGGGAAAAGRTVAKQEAVAHPRSPRLGDAASVGPSTQSPAATTSASGEDTAAADTPRAPQTSLQLLHNGCVNRLLKLGEHLESAHFNKRNLGKILGAYQPLMRDRSRYESDGAASEAGIVAGFHSPVKVEDRTPASSGSSTPAGGTTAQTKPVVPAYRVRQFVPPQCDKNAAADVVEQHALECVYIHFNRLIALALDLPFQDRVNRVLAVEREYVLGDEDVQRVEGHVKNANSNRGWSRFNRPLAGRSSRRHLGSALLDPTNLVSPLVGGGVSSSGIKSFERMHERMRSEQPGWGHGKCPFPRAAHDGDVLRCTATFDDIDTMLRSLDALGESFGSGDGFVDFQNGFQWTREEARKHYFLREVVATVDYCPQWPPPARDTATTISASQAGTPLSKNNKRGRAKGSRSIGSRSHPRARTPPLAVRRRPATFGLLREDPMVRCVWDNYLETQHIADGFARGTWRRHVLQALSWIDGLPEDTPVHMDAEVRCVLREYRDVCDRDMEVVREVARATSTGTALAVESFFRKYGERHSITEAFEADGATELMRACRDGAVDRVKQLLLNAAASSNSVESADLIDGLGVAAAYVQLGCVDALIGHVGPEALDGMGARSRQTALHRACAGSPSCAQFSLDGARAAVVMKLLEYNADANVSRETDGATPLFVAAQHSYQGVVRVLLSSVNADGIDAMTDSGATPLWVASRNNHRDSAAMLLSAKANPNAADARRRTPLHQAARGDNLECIKLLLRRKADLDACAVPPRNLTPLLVAADRGAAAAVDYLLRSKADHLARDGSGRTALECAKKQGHKNVLRVFAEWEPELRRRESLRPRLVAGAIDGGGGAEDGAPITRRVSVRNSARNLMAPLEEGDHEDDDDDASQKNNSNGSSGSPSTAVSVSAQSSRSRLTLSLTPATRVEVAGSRDQPASARGKSAGESNIIRPRSSHGRIRITRSSKDSGY